MRAKSIQSCLVTQLCLTLCDQLDCCPPGFSVHEIFQGRILEGVAISFSRGSSRHRDWTCVSSVSCFAGGFFICRAVGHVQLYNPTDYSLPYSSVHGIFQAILEWVAVPSSRGSSWPRDRTHVSQGSFISGGFFTADPPGKPEIFPDQGSNPCPLHRLVDS